MRPIDVVRKVAPNSRLSYFKAIDQGDALFKKHGITTPIRLAHFLAQIMHESGGLRIEYESGAYSANRLLEIFGQGRHSAAVTPHEAQAIAGNGKLIFERVYGLGNPRKAKELGNTQPGDGYRYRGTGLMQTTGRYNFRKMGELCGVDFEKNPELVLHPEHALKPALCEWTKGNLNTAADRNDIRAITKRINGGYNGLEDRRHWFNKIFPLIDKVDLEPAKTSPITKEQKQAGTIDKATAGAGAAAAAGAAGYAAWVQWGLTGLTIAGGLIFVGLVVYYFYNKKKENGKNNITKDKKAPGRKRRKTKKLAKTN